MEIENHVKHLSGKYFFEFDWLFCTLFEIWLYLLALFQFQFVFVFGACLAGKVPQCYFSLSCLVSLLTGGKETEDG